MRIRVGVAAAPAAVVVGAALAPTASSGVKRRRFGIAHHPRDSRSERISDGDFFSGRVRFIDNFVSRSKQRLRNTRRGRRKRVS